MGNGDREWPCGPNRLTWTGTALEVYRKVYREVYRKVYWKVDRRPVYLRRNKSFDVLTIVLSLCHTNVKFGRFVATFGCGANAAHNFGILFVHRNLQYSILSFQNSQMYVYFMALLSTRIIRVAVYTKSCRHKIDGLVQLFLFPLLI